MSLVNTLFIVATPIGHRDDFSLRAIRTLQQVERIYAEDTRHSLPLLRHHGIQTPLWPLHEHNEKLRAAAVVEYLSGGGSAALITDAGTPLISDPGYRLVRACREACVRVSPVPGASAVTAALSVSGLPTDRFQFVGFPPTRRSARNDWLQSLASVPHTLVIYESPHRIVESLHDMCVHFGGERELMLGRELTKQFETVLYGSLQRVTEQVEADKQQQRGEFVLVVAGQDEALQGQEAATMLALEKTLATLLPHVPMKTAARCAAALCGVTRKQAYDLALRLQRR